MKHHLPLLAKSIAVVLLYVMLKALISTVALSSFAKVIIDAEFDQDGVIDIYYASGLGTSNFRADYRRQSERYSSKVRTVNTTHLNNHIARKIRLDIGQQPGSIKLFSVIVTSFYGPDITFSHRDIFARFSPNEHIETFTLQPDHVLIVSRSDDPFIIFQGDLAVDNFFLNYILPAIITLLVVVIFARLPFRTFPAWYDINAKMSSAGVNFGALDGIRGLAALLVLAQHTGVVKTSGIFGVWLFFCLSGFLLATPFVHRPDRARSYSYMSHYMVRRLKRILPMYFTMITVTILFVGKFDVAIRHYLFLQADGHYWTIAQEMFFYLILPAVMFASSLLLKNSRPLPILFFALTAFAAHRLISVDVISLYGNNVTLRPMIGIFLIGVLGAFVYEFLREQFPRAIEHRRLRHRPPRSLVFCSSPVACSSPINYSTIWRILFR